MASDHLPHTSPTDDALLARSWQRAWAALGQQAPDGLMQRLLAAWAEPQRHYHSQQHLHECLALLEPALDLAQHPGEVELALWFHDAIYDPTRNDNEAESARLAEDRLAAMGEPADFITEVSRLILLTAGHTVEPGDRVGARLLSGSACSRVSTFVVVACALPLSDWGWAVQQFHRRWLPRVKSIAVDGLPLPLDADQAVALYVTGSSLSGYAFDVSVHLWQRYRTSQSKPSTESGPLPPMNTAAITSSSNPPPALGVDEFRRAATIMPARAARTPMLTKQKNTSRSVLIPDSRAAFSLPPSA